MHHRPRCIGSDARHELGGPLAIAALSTYVCHMPSLAAACYATCLQQQETCSGQRWVHKWTSLYQPSDYQYRHQMGCSYSTAVSLHPTPQRHHSAGLCHLHNATGMSHQAVRPSCTLAPGDHKILCSKTACYACFCVRGVNTVSGTQHQEVHQHMLYCSTAAWSDTEDYGPST